MIQITPQMRVLVAVEPVDLRKGIDGLAAVCREKLQADPFSGWLFIFRSRRATAIRVLVFDGQGFWMAHKRLSKGRFPWWPTAETAARRWPRIRLICCWRQAIRRPQRRRCGARWVSRG